MKTISRLRHFLALILALSLDVAFADSGARIIRLDPRFDQLVARNAKIEKIAEGFDWVEGPVWNKRETYLLFTDIPSNAVYKWRKGEGVSLFMKLSGYTGTQPF